jgi:uncharacterized protein YbaR (Trm112 family)
MVELKCPKCRSDLEVEDHKEEKDDVRVGVFCSDKQCSFHKNPLIGIERKTSKVFISESII